MTQALFPSGLQPPLTWVEQNNYVPPFGPNTAKIVLLGEAPGEKEVVERRPFVGGSGMLLRNLLGKVGINSAACYMTNVVKYRPPRNNFDTLYLDGKKRQMPTDFLIRSREETIDEIKRIKPNVTVALGAEALRCLTGYSSIGNWRGSILESKAGKCVPAYHPAYILRSYEDYPILQLDLTRVREESSSPSINIPKPRFIVNPRFDQVIEYLRRPRTRIAVDIETTGSLTRCIGFCDNPMEAISIPLMSQPGGYVPGSTKLFLTPASTPTAQSHWSEAQEYEILSRINDVMTNPKIGKILQNAPFDMDRMARELGIFTVNLEMDTMVAWHTLYPDLPKGLDFLCSVLTRFPYYSGYDPSSDYSTWIYNCWDCVVTYISADKIRKELDHEVPKQTRIYYNFIKKPAVETYLYEEQRGILVDQRLKDERTQQVSKVRDELGGKIRQMSNGMVMNPSSDHQIKMYLYDYLKLNIQFNHKTGAPSVDKFAREKLANRYAKEHGPFFALLNEYSTLDTLLTGFLNKSLDLDGRMRTHYSVAGTVSDRLSSSGKNVTTWVATALQNLPRGTDEKEIYSYRFREMFIADPDWYLMKCDLSQAEFRIVAWLARIDHVIKKYTENPSWDVHRWVASLIFRKPEDQILKAERSTAKNGVYGGNYAMMYTTAARTYKIPLDMAKFVLDSYRRVIPEIPLWWTTIDNKLRQDRTLVNPLGARRMFFGRLDDQDTFREAYSWAAQSVVSGIINRAFNIAHETFNPNECIPILQVHDEIVFLCRKGFEYAYEPRIRSIMEYPIKFHGVEEPMVIPADINYGHNWHDQKPLPKLAA